MTQRCCRCLNWSQCLISQFISQCLQEVQRTGQTLQDTLPFLKMSMLPQASAERSAPGPTEGAAQPARVTNDGEAAEAAFSPRGNPELDPFLLNHPADGGPARAQPTPHPASQSSTCGDASPPTEMELEDLAPRVSPLGKGLRQGRARCAADPYAERIDEGHLALPARMIISSGVRNPMGAPPGGPEGVQDAAAPTDAPSASKPMLRQRDVEAAGQLREPAGGSPPRAPGRGAQAGPPRLGRLSLAGHAPAGPGAPRGAETRGPGTTPATECPGSPTRRDGAPWPGLGLGIRARREPPLLLTPISASAAPDDMRMALTIGINGWPGARRDFAGLWRKAPPPADAELFALVWESRVLVALNRAVADWVGQQAGQEVIKWTCVLIFERDLPWVCVPPAG